MHEDEDGDVETGVVNPLTEAQVEIADVVLQVESIFNLPSEHIGPKHMLQLQQRPFSA